MNIVFMGTPDFTLPLLNMLIKQHNIVGIFTRAPKPVGRKQILTKTPVHIFAEENGIHVQTPVNFKDGLAIDIIKNLNPDVIIVFAYGRILPQAVLDIPKFGAINIHTSLLPNLRGANPIGRAIFNGFKKTGITVMKMDAGMDTGDILLTGEISIPPQITRGELEVEFGNIAPLLIEKYLTHPELYPPQKQEEDFTLAPKFESEEEFINWKMTAEVINNRIRALAPSPYAKFIHNVLEIKILKAEVVDETVAACVGTILSKDLKIACGEGSVLRIIELQKSGGKPLDAKTFVNGYKFEVGEVLK